MSYSDTTITSKGLIMLYFIAFALVIILFVKYQLLKVKANRLSREVAALAKEVNMRKNMEPKVIIDHEKVV